MKKGFLIQKKKKIAATIAVAMFVNSGISYTVVNAYKSDDNSFEKISSEVERYIKEADDDTKIPVWIWFEDIDQESLVRTVEETCGLSLDDISLSYDSFSNNFLLKNDITEKSTSDNISQYLVDTEKIRNDERALTREYLSTKRSIMSDAYMKQNEEFIRELEVKEDDILFKSSLTPSAIAYLSIDKIKTISKSSHVTHIDYYDDSVESAPPVVNTRDGERETMRVDDVQEITGLNGDGVNVIVFDHGCVRPEANLFEDVDISKVHTVYNGNIYSASDSSNLSNQYINESHPNLVTSTLQQFASEVNVYSVGYANYSDVEWTIQHCDIDVINGSIKLSSYEAYNDDAPAKWLDAIVNTYNIPFVASAGNDYWWQEYGWPNVISPSSGYNSIAAGAYDFTEMPNKMHDYRYNPINSTQQVNYKPDIVVASPSTSEASPMVTGIIAMMIQLKPSLAANPELVKAILMASCHRKVDPANNEPIEYMSDGLTQRQGAGAIDAYNAISIVAHETYGIGNISSGSTNVESIYSPFNGTNMNVSLAWLRQNTGTTYNNTTIGTLKELELEIIDSNDNIIKYSDKKNTCKQMVYFPLSNNEDEYTIRVKKASLDTENTRFAYAWSTDQEYLEDNTYDIDYIVNDSWGTNKNIQITITNNGYVPIRNWALKCDSFFGDVTSLWNASLLGDNIIKNTMYNSDIAVGESVTFGYTLVNATEGTPDFELCSFRKAKETGYSTQLTVLSEWDTGFNGNITITNTTDEPIMAWELNFTANNFSITNPSQFVILDQFGNNYKITGTYNGNIPIPAYTSINLQFQGQKSGTPSISNVSLSEMVIAN